MYKSEIKESRESRVGFFLSLVWDVGEIIFVLYAQSALGRHMIVYGESTSALGNVEMNKCAQLSTNHVKKTLIFFVCVLIESV